MGQDTIPRVSSTSFCYLYFSLSMLFTRLYFKCFFVVVFFFQRVITSLFCGVFLQRMTIFLIYKGI